MLRIKRLTQDGSMCFAFTAMGIIDSQAKGSEQFGKIFDVLLIYFSWIVDAELELQRQFKNVDGVEACRSPVQPSVSDCALNSTHKLVSYWPAANHDKTTQKSSITKRGESYKIDTTIRMEVRHHLSPPWSSYSVFLLCHRRKYRNYPTLRP
jgi:hypothetical protein